MGHAVTRVIFRASLVFISCLATSASTSERPALEELDPAVAHQLALEHLIRGNGLQAQALHQEAIAEWERAAAYKPDSNVPWNNMANSYTALKDLDEALRVARKVACIKFV
jgi:tetratricopeptide (TPR) repeat protein